jgi:hypothetical protein
LAEKSTENLAEVSMKKTQKSPVLLPAHLQQVHQLSFLLDRLQLARYHHQNRVQQVFFCPRCQPERVGALSMLEIRWNFTKIE